MTVTEQYTSPAWADDLGAHLNRTPVTIAEISHRLASEHEGVNEAGVERELRAHGDVFETDAGWVSLLAAADGTVLTHVLDEHEQEHGVLVADGDLDLWARLADEGLPLATGGEVRTRWSASTGPLPTGASSGLVGPTGWLDEYEPGQLLGLRLRAGALHVETLPLVDAGEAEAARLTRLSRHCWETAHAEVVAYVAEESDSCWVPLDDVVATLVVADPDVFAGPLPPLGLMLFGGGLQSDRGWLAVPGVPAMAEVEDFEPAEIASLVVAHAFLAQLREEDPGDIEDLERLLTVLAVPVAADRSADQVEAAPLPQAAVDALLDLATTDAERGLALLLAGRSAEGSGDHETAEQMLDEASRLVPGCWPVALGAAQYAAARGDVVRTDALLRSAGCPDDDPLRHAVKPLLKRPDGVVSRNRPCPCGSGRKYKVCCLRDVAHPLPARAELAYARLVAHGQQKPHMAMEIASFVQLVEPAAVPLALDLALFDGDVAEDYLACRGDLLPDDEHALLETWLDTPLAPYEVQAVQVGRSVTLRPLLGGDPVVLHDRLFSTCVEPLDVLVARLLSDGERPTLLSLPTQVHRMRRAPLLALFDDGEYDPDSLAMFFGPQRPPKLRNRDGDDLVFCEAIYEVPDDEAWARLGEVLEADPDDENVLVRFGREVTEDEFLNCGSVTRDGQRWTVATNSVERFETLQALVLDTAPNAEPAVETRRTGEELLAEHRTERPQGSSRGPFGPSDDVDLPPEEQIAFMDEYMQRYERGWVDEEIGALGGISPRDAVARGGETLAKLEAMLDDMEWMHRQNGGGMDASRIRAHLGLTATPRPAR